MPSKKWATGIEVKEEMKVNKKYPDI